MFFCLAVNYSRNIRVINGAVLLGWSVHTQTQWILCKLIYHRHWILFCFELHTNTQHIRYTLALISHIQWILSTVFFLQLKKIKETKRKMMKPPFCFKVQCKSAPKSLHVMLKLLTIINPIDALNTSYCYGMFTFHYLSGHSATDAYFSMWMILYTHTHTNAKRARSTKQKR